MARAVHAGQHREALSLEEGLGAGRDLAGDPAAEGSSLGRDARSRLHLSLARVKGFPCLFGRGRPHAGFRPAGTGGGVLAAAGASSASSSNRR